MLNFQVVLDLNRYLNLLFLAGLLVRLFPLLDLLLFILFLLFNLLLFILHLLLHLLLQLLLFLLLHILLLLFHLLLRLWNLIRVLIRRKRFIVVAYQVAVIAEHCLLIESANKERAYNFVDATINAFSFEDYLFFLEKPNRLVPLALDFVKLGSNFGLGFIEQGADFLHNLVLDKLFLNLLFLLNLGHIGLFFRYWKFLRLLG